MPGVQWTSNGLELRKRGSLVAEGALALPEFFKEARMKNWPQHSQDPQATVQGGYLVELMVDNTSGDILTLFAVVASALRVEVEDLISSIFPIFNILGPYYLDKKVYYNAEVIVDNIFVIFNDFKISLYLKSGDILEISLIINSVYKETGFDSVLSTLYIPHWKSWLVDNSSLVLDGSMHWDKNEEVIVGTYTLSGIEPLLRDILSATATLLEGRGPLFDVLYSVNTALQK